MAAPDQEQVLRNFPPGPVGPFEEVLHALVMRDPASVRVHQLAPVVAVVAIPKQDRLAALVRWVPSMKDGLPSLLAQIVGWSKDSRVEVAVFGGGADVRAAVEIATPTLTLTRLRAYHLGDDGKPWASGEVDEQWPLWLRVVEAAEGRGRAPLDWEPFREKVRADLALLAAERAEASEFATRLSRRTPWATYALLAIIIAVYGIEELLGGPHSGPVAARMGAIFPARVLAGEWWRIIASGFLHFGIPHLLMNGYVLFALGPLLEQLLGVRRFLSLWTLSLIGAGLAATWLQPRGIAMGASGALWGLLGAEAMIAYRPLGLLPRGLAPRMRKAALTNLVLNVLVSFHPGVAWSAHLGGGVVGALFVLSGLLTSGVERLGEHESPKSAPQLGGVVRETPTRRAPFWLSPLAALSVITLLAGVGLAAAHGRPWSLIARADYARVEVPELGFSLEVPAILAGLEGEGREVDGRQLALGRTFDDPLELRAAYVAADHPLTPEEQKVRLEVERAELEEGPEHAERLRGPEMVKVEGRPGISVRYRFPDQAIRDLVLVALPTGLARVSVDIWPEYTERWAGAAWRGAATIEPRAR